MLQLPSSRSQVSPVRRLNRLMWAGVACWTALVSGSLIWNQRQLNVHTRAIAREEARSAIGKDVVYRRWVMVNGGVYVPVSARTPPSPYLAHVPERDITTPSGKHLTLVNSSYMTRQVHDLASEEFGLRGHITSLKPLRPDNAPDEWEARALREFESGATEVSAIESLDSGPVLRLMRPLATDSSCLKCHGAQGYRVGDIRGGISVSVPMGRYQAMARSELSHVAVGHGLLWMFGVAGLWGGGLRLRKRIEERDRAEQALHQSEQNYRAILNATSEGIVIHDATGRILDANRRFCELIGVTAEEVVQLTIGDMSAGVPPYTHEEAVGWIHRALVEGPQLVEWLCRHKSGRLFWGEVSLRAGRIGNQDRIIAALRDISDRKRAEAERARFEARLRDSQKLEAVGQLAAGVAHDFNNLLTVIGGNVEILSAMPGIGEEAHPSIRAIREASEQATGVTRALLTFSRKLPASKQPMDLADAVERAGRLLERMLPACVELVLDTPGPGCLWVHGDRTQIQQIVLNLAINARDAMPDGGTLRIAVRAATEAAAPSAAAGGLPAGSAVLVVSDTGTGISPEVQARIFEPFFTTKARGRGTGLGLSIIHGIVTDHAGRIEVHSHPGQGATFEVYLPLIATPVRADGSLPVVASPQTQQPCPPAQEAAGNGPSGPAAATILLAEDNDQIRGLVGNILSRAGHRVVPVSDGEALMQKFREQNGAIRLLILDIDLPRRSGLDCLRLMRSSGCQAPAIFITGQADAELGTDLRDNAQLLPKPFNMDALTQMVARSLNGPG